MSNLLDRPPKIYHKKLHMSFDWVIGNEIKVKKTIVMSGKTVEEVIESTYPQYELEALLYIGKKDNTGKDLIEGDEICYGEDQENYGVITWSNYWMTWVITPRENSIDKLSLLIRDYDSKHLHFISHKHGDTNND